MAKIKKLKLNVNDLHGRVGDLETKVDASNHSVYSLMQAAVGDKSPRTLNFNSNWRYRQLDTY